MKVVCCPAIFTHFHLRAFKRQPHNTNPETNSAAGMFSHTIFYRFLHLHLQIWGKKGPAGKRAFCNLSRFNGSIGSSQDSCWATYEHFEMALRHSCIVWALC